MMGTDVTALPRMEMLVADMVPDNPAPGCSTATATRLVGTGVAADVGEAVSENAAEHGSAEVVITPKALIYAHFRA
jgi:hypothetical protein